MNLIYKFVWILATEGSSIALSCGGDNEGRQRNRRKDITYQISLVWLVVV